MGSVGPDGVAGEDGVNAFTTLATTLIIPAATGPVLVSPTVTDSSWIAVGQTIFVSDETSWGTFTVDAIVGNVIDLTYLDTPSDTPGGTIAIGGTVTPSGTPGALAAALPASLTDNSLGTASNIISVDTGKVSFGIYLRANAITGNVLLFTYTPGYAFKIVRISATVVDAITTGAKAATLTTAINGVPTTGGIVIMSGTYALGAEQASSAAITAANEGTNAEAITVTASAVTQFTQGGFMLYLEIQNMNTVNAFSSLSDHINDLIISLT